MGTVGFVSVEFLARLAAVVPPPRYPLVRYYGVLASASRWRSAVVPRPPADAGRRPEPPAERPGGRRESDTGATADSSARTRREVSSTGVSLLVPSPGDDPEAPPNVITVRHWRRLLDGLLLARSPRLDWESLLRRTFGIDALECPRCRGRLRVLDVVTEPEDARRILREAGLACEPPPRARATDPTAE